MAERLTQVKDCTIVQGDCLETLRLLPDQSVQMCVTSPPYFGLRDYGTGVWEGGDVACDHRHPAEQRQLPHGDGRVNDSYADTRGMTKPGVGAAYKDVCAKCGARRIDSQLGLEKTPDDYVTTMVGVFREVRRVLRDDGVLWLNLGDSYCGYKGDSYGKTKGNLTARTPVAGETLLSGTPQATGLKHKDLIGIPWRVAFALQADGWYLRQDIIWHKPNPMPESVTDRCTKAHEYIFMLTKSARYYYDHNAIKTPPSEALLKQVADGYNGVSTKDYAAGGAQEASPTKARIIEGARKKLDKQRGHGRRHAGFNDRWGAMTKNEQQALGANKRSVWTVTTKPYKGAHFATFPPDLIEPCVLAASRPGDVVLDPFGGAGTTGLVAQRHGRRSLLLELNEDYCGLIRERLEKDGVK